MYRHILAQLLKQFELANEGIKRIDRLLEPGSEKSEAVKIEQIGSTDRRAIPPAISVLSLFFG